jgi:hypothetical protein
LILLGLPTAAFAEGDNPEAMSPVTPSVAGQNSMTDLETAPTVLDHVYMSIYSDLQGSSLKQLGSPYQENQTTGLMSKSPMYFATDATLAYLITPQIGVGPYAQLNYTPVLGQGVQWLDVGVTAFNRHLVHTDHLTIMGNIIVEAPTDSYDINRGMYLGLKSSPYVRYEIPHSRFTLGAWTEFKDYMGSTSGKLVKTYYEPYVAYSVVKQLSLSFAYELEYDHYAATSGMKVYETDIQPGLLWFITPKIVFNPYLQWFTNNRITADTAAFGMSLAARFL